jgi:tRNA(fMet)-specific endonuclease VapC
MICLDANVVIGILNGEPVIRRRLEAIVSAGDRVAISVIVLFELIYGAEHSARRQHNLDRVEKFLAGAVDIIPFDAVDATEAAELREELERLGTPIGPYDILIAAQARRRDATLVTANDREFGRVAGLRTVNWARG